MKAELEVIYTQTQQLAEIGFKLGALEERIKIEDLNRDALILSSTLRELKEESLRLDNSIRSTLISLDEECYIIEAEKSHIFK